MESQDRKKFDRELVAVPAGLAGRGRSRGTSQNTGELLALLGAVQPAVRRPA